AVVHLPRARHTGAGQMYYGYMRRGLSLITLFCVSFGLTALFSVFGVLLPVIWMFSFFDTYDLAHRMLNGTPKEDNFLLMSGDLSLDFMQKLPSSKKLLGWGMIALGVIALYSEFLRPVLARLFGWNFVDRLPTVVVAVLLIIGGVRLLQTGGSWSAPSARTEELPFPREDTTQGDDASAPHNGQ
ncbi:MAG: hypothetical protein ACI4OL_05400, partial [Gemmiger sp.]